MNTEELEQMGVSLAEAESIFKFLTNEILINRLKCPTNNFFFDCEISHLIDGRLAFARVDVIGDIYRITFHRYPPEIEHAASKSKMH